jgi:hypothetical protein
MDQPDVVLMCLKFFVPVDHKYEQLKGEAMLDWVCFKVNF